MTLAPVAPPQLKQLSQEEFFAALKESLIVLTTSSPDKRKKYQLLFTSLGMDDDPSIKAGRQRVAGINASFTDIGQFGDVAQKTPELTNSYDGNGGEKAAQQYYALKHNEQEMRDTLKKSSNIFDPEKVRIVGMTEDSGWQIVLKKKDIAKKQNFIQAIKDEIKPLLRPQDWHLLDSIDLPAASDDKKETGFPGPNLKPIQEHIHGFGKLMEVIYNAADKAGIQELNYVDISRASFTFPDMDAVYTENFAGKGRLLTRTEYQDKILSQPGIGLVNSDYVHVPAGQRSEDGIDKTVEELNSRLFTTSSSVLPAAHSRRNLTEWLQAGIGTHTITNDSHPLVNQRDRIVRIGLMTPDNITDLGRDKDYEQWSPPAMRDLMVHTYPTDEDMWKDPSKERFGSCDAIVLFTNKHETPGKFEEAKSNLDLLQEAVLATVVEPGSMNKPLIVDNRNGAFDTALQIIGSGYNQGSAIGDAPFVVAQTTDELYHYLAEAKNVTQRSPVIVQTKNHAVRENIKEIPNDGVFTLFIAGGHNNNNRQDLENAHDLGYTCAKEGWRVVTGAGVVEGTMGAVHTGWVQYQLDQIKPNGEAFDMLNKLGQEYKLKRFDEKAETWMTAEIKFDAEKLILDHPEVIEKLADSGVIDRQKFYCYSVKSLLKLESATGEPPPGSVFSETGNLSHRLVRLLAAGTHVAGPGDIGTHQEIRDSIATSRAAHGIDQEALEINAALEAKLQSINRQGFFADGTPDKEGAIIIHNSDGRYDNLLDQYGLRGEGTHARIARKKYGVTIVTTHEETIDAIKERAKDWKQRRQQELAQSSSGKTIYRS